MQIYYSSLQAIEQATMQLDLAQCAHCQQRHQLVSHGFIRKKQIGGPPVAVGKRVFCSNRKHRKGCGRTMQLYLDATLRYLHHAGHAVVAFMLSLMAGASIQRAYQHATRAATARNALRWLDRLCAKLSAYRSLSHRPSLQESGQEAMPARRPVRRAALTSTFESLVRRFGQPLCASYQQQLQQAFL